MDGEYFVENAVRDQLQRRGYKNINPLGKGGFGAVLSAITAGDKKVAIKMIPDKFSWHIEATIWPLLRHANILPLLETISLADMNVKLYVMPCHPIALHFMIQSEDFQKDRKGLLRIKKWLTEVANALKYLHCNGFAHLDVKMDNVLISAQDSAVLCDFSGLNITEIKITRLVSPMIFRPPECHTVSRAEGIDGSAFDVWTYGLMALNVLTGHYPHSQMPKANTFVWGQDVWPIIKTSLQCEMFIHLVRKALPSVPLTEEDLRLARNFVSSLLSFDPGSRPTMDEVETHLFLEMTSAEHQFGSGDMMPRQGLNAGDMMLRERLNVLNMGKRLFGSPPVEIEAAQAGVVNVKARNPFFEEAILEGDVPRNPSLEEGFSEAHVPRNPSLEESFSEAPVPRNPSLEESFSEAPVPRNPCLEDASIEADFVEERCEEEKGVDSEMEKLFGSSMYLFSEDMKKLKKGRKYKKDCHTEAKPMRKTIQHWIQKKWKKLFAGKKASYVRLV